MVCEPVVLLPVAEAVVASMDLLSSGAGRLTARDSASLRSGVYVAL